MIISRTPFRMSFFGGGTDFPDFFKQHGGSTLSVSINQYCYVLIHPISGQCFGYNYKASYAKTETVDNISDLHHPLIRETLRFLDVEPGLEVDHVSDLPGRTGLGSSSSFTVALLNALHTMRGESIAKTQLSEEAIHIERDMVGDPGGHQDQYAVAFGGMNRIEYEEDGTTVTPLEIDQARMEQLENHIMLFYIGLARTSTPILQDQQKRTETNTQTLLEMRDMVDQAQTMLISKDHDIKDFGILLNEGWQLKRRLTSKITTPEIDEAYDAALDAGALGGKLLGAGGGGFLLVFADPSCQHRISERLSSLHPVPIAFDNSGATIIHNT